MSELQPLRPDHEAAVLAFELANRAYFATSLGNVASQKALANAGFVEVGPANPGDLGGKPGTGFQRSLAS
jgi:hypothetical protein